MSNLESKVAVITGGSTGIGLASAKEFIKAGATVVLFARTRKDLDTAESDLDPNSYVIGGDVTRLGDLDRLYSETKSKFGGIDVLFINSAQGKLVPIADTTKSIYDEMIDCHIPVVLLTAKADKRSKIEGLQTGADDYLSKPFSTEELKVRVTNLIAQRMKLAAIYSASYSAPVTAAREPSLDDKFLAKARKIVEDNISETTFGVEKMADEMHLSRTQLFRKLKAISGMSPNELINEIRLQKAAELILAKADTLAQISYSVGFNEQSYFAKRFRKKFGVNPSEYSHKNIPHKV